MSFLFLQLFITYSPFCSQSLQPLLGPNAPGPLQNAESEKTCTFAVGMLPIGSFNNDPCSHHFPGLLLASFFGLYPRVIRCFFFLAQLHVVPPRHCEPSLKGGSRSGTSCDQSPGASTLGKCNRSPDAWLGHRITSFLKLRSKVSSSDVALLQPCRETNSRQVSF